MKADPTRYFLDLNYNTSPWYSSYLGGGFGAPSLGGTAILIGIGIVIDGQKQ